MTSTLNDRQRRVTLGILVGAWLIMVVPMAAAQEVDSRWAPWIGCWRAVDERAAAPVLCVVPLAGEAAIEMLTMFDGQVVSRESIFTDGRQRGVSREGCEGWERAEFSDDSRRIYLSSELTCGASARRSSTGVISMVSPFEWLDVRTVDVDGRNAPWVGRYRPASQADIQAAGQGDLVGNQSSEARMARVAASIPISPDDVIEATGKVSAETVQLWVVERGEAFALDATALIEMADSGVPSSVIDVVVAVSYPEKFVINEGGSSRPRPAEAGRERRRSARGYYGSRFGYGSGYYGRYGYGYGGYGGPYGYGGYGLGYGYGGYGLGYGYGGYGLGYPYGGYGSPIIVVGRRSGSRAGRVVREGGYTTARGSDGSTGRSARPRSSGPSSRAGAPAARSTRPRSSGSSGSAARSAPSRGSSSSSPQSTGRRAQPRARRGN